MKKKFVLNRMVLAYINLEDGVKLDLMLFLKYNEKILIVLANLLLGKYSFKILVN